MHFSTSFLALASLTTATLAGAAPARHAKRTAASDLSPAQLLDTITTELESTTASVQSAASGLTGLLGGLAGATGSGSGSGGGNPLGGLLGGLLGGAKALTASPVSLDSVTALLDKVVGEVTSLQSTLEDLTETGQTVTSDLATGDVADALAALVAEVQKVVTAVTSATSSVPGLGPIADGFSGSVNDPLSAITGLLGNLIPGLLAAVQELLASLLSGLTGGLGGDDLLSGITSILNLRRRLA